MGKVIYGIQASNVQKYEDSHEWILYKLYEDEADAISALLHIANKMTAEDLSDRYCWDVSDDGFTFKFEKITCGCDNYWDDEEDCPEEFETIGLTFTDIENHREITPYWIKKFELA